MSGSYEIIVMPLLAAVGGFAFVGLIWNLFEGYYEEQRRDSN